MPGTPWTDRELELLERLYPEHGISAVQDATGRSEKAVMAKAAERKIRRNGRWRGRRWTEREDELVRRNYGTLPSQALARELNRSVKAVQRRAELLRVTARRHGEDGTGCLTDTELEIADALYARGLSYHAIGDILGVSHVTISRYVIPDIRRHYRRTLITNAKRRLQQRNCQAGQHSPPT